MGWISIVAYGLIFVAVMIVFAIAFLAGTFYSDSRLLSRTLDREDHYRRNCERMMEVIAQNTGFPLVLDSTLPVPSIPSSGWFDQKKEKIR